MSTTAMPSPIVTVKGYGGPTVIHEKIIYAKSKGLTNKEMEGIMLLECDNFLRANPGYEFEKMLETKKNPDQSRTHYFQFKRIAQ